jgi:hypothetical protein
MPALVSDSQVYPTDRYSKAQNSGKPEFCGIDVLPAYKGSKTWMAGATLAISFCQPKCEPGNTSRAPAIC